MIYQRESINRVRWCVATGMFNDAKREIKRVHPSWLPELLVDPSPIVRKVANRRLKRESTIRKLWCMWGAAR